MKRAWAWQLTFDGRFWARVEKADGGCWNWIGAKDRDGYGDIRTSGTHRSAHRYAYETLVGPIPDGLTLDHLCRNHSCVNPTHLEPVTNAENIRRGEGRSALNARKTHCHNGHELAGDNLISLSRGGRVCKTCHREAMRARGSKRAEYMRRYRRNVPADPALRSASRFAPGAGSRRAEGGADQRAAS